MKRTCLIFGAIFLVRFMAAQGIQNEVISSAGDMHPIGNILVSWTIGECLTEHYCNTDCRVSQGFHQSYYKILEIPENDHHLPGIRVYPNPATNLLNIDLASLPPGKKFQVVLSSMEGKVLWRQESSSRETIQLFLSEYPEGTMIIKVIDPPTSSSSSFKIIKVNR